MASYPANGRPRPLTKAAAATLAAALSATLLAGCGGSSKGSDAKGDHGAAATTAPTVPALPADQPPRPACGLITQAEVEAAVGARVSPGRETTQEGRSACSFALATGADQNVSIVSASSSGVPAAFEAARKSAEGAQPVNAGDQAFVTGGQAAVRKGNTMVIVLLFVRQDRTQLATAATKLVQSVGTHL
jgi:hypothetical protein